MSATSAQPPASATPYIVGDHPELRAALARASLVAPTRTPVLVTGESGTGKELLARLLHEQGPSPRGALVAVNCGALSRELAESELFGHERGSFTGAAGRRQGWFEEASGGTLVLDEIGELPLELQPKLLRVLETGRLRRVGGSGEIAVQVRIVAMTLRDLRRDAIRGDFRLDLYHRLAGFELSLPPLRRRPGDIPLLVRHFLKELEAELGPRAVEPEALSRLAAHDWPGNVRELRNVIRRAAILTGSRIDAASIELEPVPDGRPAGRAADAPPDGAIGWGHLTSPGASPPPPSPVAADLLSLAGKSFGDIEREVFSWALRRSGWSRRRAAAALGISRSTFCDRVRRLGLAPPCAAVSPSG
jgi:DNA-binding NtrC family response regulator